MAAIPPPGPTLASAREARVDSWTSYWRGGALHSCAGSFAGNYEGPLREFWGARFAELEDAARVLDVCCGNAPLSQMLVDDAAFQRRAARIDAVDLADIDPPWLADLDDPARQRVRVHPRVDAALLPFDDDTFQLCMSQFGIEYAGAAALAELRRVLAPGGCIAALVHHHDSLPTTIAREELEHAAWLADESLAEQAAALIPAMARSATAEGQQALRVDAVANDQRARFNGSLQRLQQRRAEARFPDLLEEVGEALMGLLQQARQAGEGAAQVAFERWQGEYRRGLLRQRELVEHAFDEQTLSVWMAPLQGLETRVQPIAFSAGGLAGWGVLARAPR